MSLQIKQLEEAQHEELEAKRALKNGVQPTEDELPGDVVIEEPKGQRQQPKSEKKKKKPAPKKNKKKNVEASDEDLIPQSMEY